MAADHMAISRHHMEEVFKLLCPGIPKAHKASRAIRRYTEASCEVRNQLDNLYHSVTSAEQFNKAGHAYYDLDKRFREITNQ
jgi:hypothetical protein